MVSFSGGRPRYRGSGSGSSRPRVVFGSTVEIVNYVLYVRYEFLFIARSW